MQVFNTYFRLVQRKKRLILMYIIIFTAIAVVMMKVSTQDENLEKYTRRSVKISVIDRDKSSLSKSLKAYLTDQNEMVSIPDKEKRIKDELYWRNVEYVLIIPENFQQLLEEGQKVDVISKKIDDAVNAVYVDEEIKLFMSLFSLYQSAGYSVEDAIGHVEKDVAHEVLVDTVTKEDGESAFKVASEGQYYFQYVPYVLVSVCILAISCILAMFYQEDVRKRCICSSMKLKDQNQQLVLASLLFSFGVTILFIIIGIVVTKGELLGQINLLFYSINALAFMFVSIALAFMLANLFHSETALNGCSNVFSLGFCFLGGIFVPLWVMPDSVVTFAHFVPTYWYVQANDAVSYMTRVTSPFLKEFFLNVGVQMCFAVALLSIGLVVSKKRRVFS